MFDILEILKKNRIKIIKIIITIIVIYFLFNSLIVLFSEFARNLFRAITLFYCMLIILCNLLSEFSPYVLHNYLLLIFPFLSNYFGRGIIYIIIGILYITPELEKKLNLAGYGIIFIGILCLYTNSLLAKNIQVEYQDFVVMKDKYQDFSDNSLRESLEFPKRTNIIQNNINNEI